jgi:hypothetical protein
MEFLRKKNSGKIKKDIIYSKICSKMNEIYSEYFLIWITNFIFGS